MYRLGQGVERGRTVCCWCEMMGVAFPAEWSLRQVCHLRQMKKLGRMDLRHLRLSPAQADQPSDGARGTHAEAAAGQLCVSQPATQVKH